MKKRVNQNPQQKKGFSSELVARLDCDNGDCRSFPGKSGQKPALETPSHIPAVKSDDKKETVSKKAKLPKSRDLTKLVASAKTKALHSWTRLKSKLVKSDSDVGQTRQKAMVLLMPILAIVLVVVLIYVFSAAPGNATAGEPDEVSAGTDFSTDINWEIPSLYSGTLRDPMQFISLSSAQADSPAPQVEQIVVKSILYSESNPSAVIGNEIIHVGDTVLGAAIIKINQNSVEFEKDGKRWSQMTQR